jgi:hypothetical protein
VTLAGSAVVSLGGSVASTASFAGGAGQVRLSAGTSVTVATAGGLAVPLGTFSFCPCLFFRS